MESQKQFRSEDAEGGGGDAVEGQTAAHSPSFIADSQRVREFVHDVCYLEKLIIAYSNHEFREQFPT